MEKAGTPPKRVEVLPYKSLYPSEEAQKAVKLVQDEISGHQKELDRLRDFAADNSSLINLVRRLPDELSHDIMVPFGKAAFFPGRLIHTNEFLVLLGEGYHADQTAKQTIGVLKRRGQVLESKIEALTSVIQELEARINFFGETAEASGEGMVEIREYEGPPVEDKYHSDSVKISAMDKESSQISSDSVKTSIADEEYARIVAGLDEYEKAELAAESVSSNSEETQLNSDKFQQSSNNLDKKNLPEQHTVKRPSNDQPNSKVDPISRKDFLQQVFSESLSLDDSKPHLKQDTYQTQVGGNKYDGYQSAPKDTSLVKPDYSLDGSQKPAVSKEKHQASIPTDHASESSEHGFYRGKAVIGSVVEHSHGLDSSIGSSTSHSTSQDTTSKPSKPVSRFKMQRGS